MEQINKFYKLMIVESGAKAKIIKSYLETIEEDSIWDVIPSEGHIQSLNSDKKGIFGSLGIDKTTLEMDYKLTTSGTRVIDRLKDKISKRNYARIVVATDLDREGEAIAGDLVNRLGLGNNYDRCDFNEITIDALRISLNNPRKVNMYLTKAQRDRRMLDRVVGWEAGTAVGRVLNKKTPMGRVISQTVKFIVDRERVREAWVQKTHYGIRLTVDDWTADIDLKRSGLVDFIDIETDPNEDEDDSPEVEATEKYWYDKELANKISDTLAGKALRVVESETNLTERFAPPPFETSTLQQEASKKLNWTAKKCDSIAQKLYENAKVTYIRTDCTVISDTAFSALQLYCKDNGLRAVETKREGKKGVVDQEAHECIRPTNFKFDGTGLTDDEKLLYELIRTRCIASQLSPMISEVTTLVMVSNEGYYFKATGSVLIDIGWQVIMGGADKPASKSKNPVPTKVLNDEIIVNTSTLITTKTRKPPRLNQSTLGALLTKHGIARPSSYADIYEKIGANQHGYITQEGKFYKPSEHANKMVEVTEKELCVMDAAFTKAMEQQLTDIANGNGEGDAYIFNFFKRLDSNLADILKNHTKPPEKCFSCNLISLIRVPRSDGSGYFWGCRNNQCGKRFSDKEGKPIEFDAQFINEDGTPKYPCPKCEKHLIRIFSKKTAKFWWICSQKKVTGCDVIFDDNKKEEPDFEAKKQRDAWFKSLKDAYDENGSPIHPCPECGKALIKKLSQKEEYYFNCIEKKQGCDFFVFADSEGNPKEK